MDKLIWTPEDSTVIGRVIIHWSEGATLVPTGTPIDSSGCACNDGTAAGILAEDVPTDWYFEGNARKNRRYSREATIITAGYVDLSAAQQLSGLTYTDACKAALTNIKFIDPSEGLPAGAVLPEVTAADDGKVLKVSDGAWTAGEAGGGSGGGMVVTLTVSMEDDEFSGTADKSVAEIISAMQSGTYVALNAVFNGVVVSTGACMHVTDSVAYFSPFYIYNGSITYNFTAEPGENEDIWTISI